MKPARNLRLTIAFDGTAYHGWQIQKDQITIQGCLAEAIEKITGERISPSGSGRTDAGTHARRLVANFVTSAHILPAQLVKALNSVLPRDIRILSARREPLTFHSRRNARSKVYRYQIYRGKIMLPHLAREHFHYPYPLDVDKMKSAARLFVGEHDFAAFAAKCGASDAAHDIKGPARSTVRRILRCELKQLGRRLLFTVEGNGFLHHMVRNMAGTLLEIGRGQISREEFQALFTLRDRKLAGFTAPAHGLILLRVHYPSAVKREKINA